MSTLSNTERAPEFSVRPKQPVAEDPQTVRSKCYGCSATVGPDERLRRATLRHEWTIASNDALLIRDVRRSFRAWLRTLVPSTSTLVDYEVAFAELVTLAARWGHLPSSVHAEVRRDSLRLSVEDWGGADTEIVERDLVMIGLLGVRIAIEPVPDGSGIIVVTMPIVA